MSTSLHATPHCDETPAKKFKSRDAHETLIKRYPCSTSALRPIWPLLRRPAATLLGEHCCFHSWGLCPSLLLFDPPPSPPHPRTQSAGSSSLSLLLGVLVSGFVACLLSPTQNILRTETRPSKSLNATGDGLRSDSSGIWDSKPSRTNKGRLNPRAGRTQADGVTCWEMEDPTLSAVKVVIRPASVLSPSQSTPQSTFQFGFNLRIVFPFKSELAAQASHGLL